MFTKKKKRKLQFGKYDKLDVRYADDKEPTSGNGCKRLA